jgi:regulator of sigma E protease
MEQDPQPWEFRSKPSWQRLIIMLGGVTVNFVLAALVYIFIAFAYGDADVDTKTVRGGYLISNPVLENIGLKTGDNILAIDGSEIAYYTEIRKKIITAKTMTISRNGDVQTLEFPVDFLGQLSTSKSRDFIDLRIPFIFDVPMEGSVDSDVDLQPGDLLIAIDGEPAQFSDQSTPLLLARKGQAAVLSVLRNGTLLERKVQVNAAGMIEFIRKTASRDFEAAGFRKIIRKEYSLAQSIGIGLHQFNETVVGYWAQLKLIFSPSTGAYKGVGGFKAIMDIFPETWSWYAFWNITAFLSIMLGVLNLLPIPALDGGHVVFLLYEMVTGRKPGDKFMEYAQTVGFFILIALVLFANGNDIYKAIFS